MAADSPVLTKWWWAIFCGLAIVLVLPLWIVTYPPGVDLPQHAAQVTIGFYWSDLSIPYQETYALNPYSQSLLAHGLVFLFGLGVSVVTAIKLTLTLALLAIPLASLRIVRAVDGDPLWVFATFPIAYSFGFYWGFLNFVVSIPLGLLLVGHAAHYIRDPSKRNLILLGLAPPLVFLGHVLSFGVMGLAAAIAVFFGCRGGARWRGLGALAACIPFVAAWFLSLQSATENTTPIPTILDIGFHRVLDFPNALVAIPNELAYTALGVLVLVSPFLVGAKLAPWGWRWAPVLVALVLYLVAPRDFFGTAFLFPRFAVFVLPCLLIALDRGNGVRFGAWLIAGLALMVSLTVVFRFAAFESEASSFQDVASVPERGARVLGLTYGAESAHIPYPVYLHWVQWMQVERQVVADFSFAEFFPNRFNYLEDPNLPANIEWLPMSFRWTKHQGEIYDYFLIRHPNRMPFNPMRGATTTFEKSAEARPWLLIRQIHQEREQLNEQP